MMELHMTKWEARSALRYGSESEGFFASRKKATDHANEDIANHGGVGKIELIDRKNRVVYYTNYPDEA
jgi:hypothetical protein